MALITMDGFDDGLAAKRHARADGSMSTSYGRHDKGTRVGSSLGKGFAVLHGSSDSTLIIGGNVNVRNSANGFYLLAFTEADAKLSPYFSVAVRTDPTNQRLYVTDQTGTTYGANGSFINGTWYYLELKVDHHATTGSWELRLDGVTYLSASNRNTVRTNVPASYFRTCGEDGIAGDDVSEIWFDDFYISDGSGTENNDFSGITKIVTLLPNGNGNSSGMDGSDGNQVDNYLLVDNNASIPPATTEYVDSITEGDKDTYPMEDLTDTPTVFGMLTSVYASKDDTGAKYMRSILRSGGTDYVGTSRSLATDGWDTIDEMYELDPNTSSQWLYGGVNAVEVGQEVRDS